MIRGVQSILSFGIAFQLLKLYGFNVAGKVPAMGCFIHALFKSHLGLAAREEVVNFFQGLTLSLSKNIASVFSD